MDFQVYLKDNIGATWVINIVLLLLGFVMLVKGADYFVDGAAGIAKKLRISTFIIGVTVVAIGTSAPELAVTIVDAVSGTGNVIIGNILGSNALNILLILGVSALICHLPTEKSTRAIDMPFLIFVSALFLILGVFVGKYEFGFTEEEGLLFLDGTMTWYCGLILILLYIAFMVYNILLAKKQSKARLEQATATAIPAEAEEAVTSAEELSFFKRLRRRYEDLQIHTWFLIVIVVCGLALVVLGAQLVVDSATVIAENLLSVPTEIVAMTVVAFGTSLPELITSVSAARKGDVGIATGNIIGSNVANILLIGGVGALCTGSTGIPFTMEGMVGGIVSLIAALTIYAFSVGSKSKGLGKAAGATLIVMFVLYYGLVFLNNYVLRLYLPSDITPTASFLASTLSGV